MAKTMIKTEVGWNFDNSYARLPESFFSKIDPTPVRAPELVILNSPLAESLGFSVQALQKEEGVAVLAGNLVPDGAQPLAQAYGGHQFGYFTMLGDGRAILIGEQITPQGERFDIQLKGSGKTPYSRGGDGRAALGPMLREYLISEAMHALGIPTTRSLAVVTTGEPVYREKVLPGAILTRVATSHIRVGTFQHLANWGSLEDLRILADYTLQRHFPEAQAAENRYLELLREVIKRQATLIAKWQLVGFVHGVMNTDNMALSGETIDYGPCAFMDTYDPATVFSSIDRYGRYAYGNQPQIALWNLTRFAETLLPLLHSDQDQAQQLALTALEEFADLYRQNWLQGMRAKLGIYDEETGDELLFTDLLSLMQKYKADYTNTFRALTLKRNFSNLKNLEDTTLFATAEFISWAKRWQERLQKQQGKRALQLMKNANPAVIPRNHRVEEALKAAVEEGDYSLLDRFLAVLANPYAYSPDQVEYTTLPPPTCSPYRTFCGT